MPAEWYYSDGNEIRGPFEMQLMVSLAKRGYLKPTDQVRRGDDGQWVVAQSIEGLIFSRACEPESEMGMQEFDVLSASRRFVQRIIIGVSFAAAIIGAWIIGRQNGHTATVQSVSEAQSRAAQAERVLGDSKMEFARVKGLQSRDAERVTSLSEEIRTLRDRVAELESKADRANQDLIAARGERDSARRQAETAANNASAKEDMERRKRLTAEEVARQARVEASKSAEVRLNEYLLTSSDGLTTRAALFALKKISLLHNEGKPVDFNSLGVTRTVLRECTTIIKIGGDVIPKDSKYTLSQSWTYALGGE